MSVVVQMEMPKACSWIENGEKKKCPISEWGGACAITKQFKMPDGCRPSWCPIVCQLPEGHGDLIDRAATINAILGEPPDAHYQSWYAEIVNDIPTIIHAERKVE